MRFTSHAPTFIVYAKNLNELIVLDLNTFPVKILHKINLQTQIFDIDSDPFSKSSLLLCQQKHLVFYSFKH